MACPTLNLSLNPSLTKIEQTYPDTTNHTKTSFCNGFFAVLLLAPLMHVAQFHYKYEYLNLETKGQRLTVTYSKPLTYNLELVGCVITGGT